MASTLITPVEPGPLRRSRKAAAALMVEHSVCVTAFGRIEAAVASSCGTQHSANEDAHSALSNSSRMFVVADGVGGGAMAQMASQHLVAHLHAALDSQRLDADRIRAAMLDADRAIARRIAQLTDLPGAATVALCAPVNALASKWLVAWVGDCRVLRLRVRGEPDIELLTRDDTFRALDETPPTGGSLDDPARMVGNGATSGANVELHEVACGDVLILCSDGMHRCVQASDWLRMLQRPVALAKHCEDLIALARANGSTDDATVLLLQRVCLGDRRARWITRFVNSTQLRGPQP